MALVSAPCFESSVGALGEIGRGVSRAVALITNLNRRRGGARVQARRSLVGIVVRVGG